MTSREQWVETTRESVGRALALEHGVPMSAQALYGSLDCDTWSFGGPVTRSEREISAALRWHVEQGNAERVLERTEYDPAGVCYAVTRQGSERYLR